VSASGCGRVRAIDFGYLNIFRLLAYTIFPTLFPANFAAVEKNSSRVYCRCAVASNNASKFLALKIRSIVALSITVMGLAWMNRSQIGLKMLL